jgi:hypothetical protein
MILRCKKDKGAAQKFFANSVIAGVAGAMFTKASTERAFS